MDRHGHTRVSGDHPKHFLGPPGLSGPAGDDFSMTSWPPRVGQSRPGGERFFTFWRLEISPISRDQISDLSPHSASGAAAGLVGEQREPFPVVPGPGVSPWVSGVIPNGRRKPVPGRSRPFPGSNIFSQLLLLCVTKSEPQLRCYPKMLVVGGGTCKNLPPGIRTTGPWDLLSHALPSAQRSCLTARQAGCQGIGSMRMMSPRILYVGHFH